jgi:RNA polymerase sigma-70 factor (ECF subfamily)
MENAETRGSTLSQSDDRALVEAVLAGEQAAYGTLYDRYAPLIRAICHDTVRSVPDAQDLAQDVFLRAYERLSRLRKPDRFGPWIVTMARLQCREWRRQRSRERQRHARLDTGKPVACGPSEGVASEALRKMMAQLPEKERLALHVFYLQGNSTDDSCRIVGLSRSGLYRALDRARKQLRTLLAQELEDIR